MNQDSYQAMLAIVQSFHDKHDFKNYGGEDLAEESADLLILLIGTAISANFDLNQTFWKKMEKLDKRQSKMVNGKIRVSEFKGVN